MSTQETRPGLSFDITPEKLIQILSDYAFNGMEVCRICNGIDPFDFKGCNYSTKEKEWFAPKGGCRHEQRGCKFRYSMVYYRLMKLYKKGLIKSLKLKWLDGRDTGAVNYIPLDNFRYFFTNPNLLATRLCQDVICKIGDPEYL